MKVLIVDDELHVREAIRLLVDWSTYGIETILEAQDGDMAALMIELEQPQLVFTDMMMPGKNGTELLEWIGKHAPRTKTIVISGHDSFDLVRKTVKYGGMDYILKPIDPEQLNEAVAKAIHSRKLEDEELQKSQRKSIEINQLRPAYLDKILTHLVEDPVYYSAIAETLREEFGLTPVNLHCCVAVFAADTIEPKLLEKFAGSQHLLNFSLLNICNEFIRKEKLGVAFQHDHGDVSVIVWKNTAFAADLLMKIYEGIRQALGSRFEFGLGSEQLMPLGLRQSYQEAVSALRQRNMRIVRQPIHRFDANAALKPAALHLSDYEDKLRFAIRSGQSVPIKQAVQQWIDQVRLMEYINVEQLELWRHEYSLIKARWLKELFGELPQQTFVLPSEAAHYIVPLDETGRLSLTQWQVELEEGLIRLSKLWIEHKRQEEHIIFDIAKYIDTHYEHDLTLQDIAERFYLSREYISRKFKLQFDVNLSEYIEKLRIGKAKLLLLNPHYRIVQIAEMVGYNDEKYFSKVFKKLEGLSPSEYRKQQP